MSATAATALSTGGTTAAGRSSRYIAINKESVDYLYPRCKTWAEIAANLGVSLSKLEKWRRGPPAYSPPVREVNDAELDVIVRNRLVENVNIGEVMLAGYLQSEGYDITRQRLRDSIWRVDPQGRILRRSVRCRRVLYHVHGPHHLWHIDGCHQLIEYGLVVHGGIDGYSRTIVFLQCVDNNRAATMLRHFRGAVEEYGLPVRTRSDKGTENVGVSRYMIEQRGAGKAAMLTGTSMRNQRIERLWRDCSEQVLCVYRTLFMQLRAQHHVDMSYERVRFVVHHVLMRRIQEDLDRFRVAWNHHANSSERGYSPLQILFRDAHLSGSGPTTVDAAEYGVEGDVIDDEEEDGEPGEEQQQDVEEEEEEELAAHAVHVAPTRCPVSPDVRALFEAQVQPLRLTDPLTSVGDAVQHALVVMEALVAANA